MTRRTAMSVATLLVAVELALITILLNLNTGHSTRVRSAWSRWHASPTAENKQILDGVARAVWKEYTAFGTVLVIVILLDGYAIFRFYVAKIRRDSRISAHRF
mgnify:CR=1 FL=1